MLTFYEFKWFDHLLSHKSSEGNLGSSKKWEEIQIQIKHKRKCCICIIFHTMAVSKSQRKHAVIFRGNY